jgi:phenylacetate-coenzyme A ligase PaaK-like adenylate-forming protein
VGLEALQVSAKAADLHRVEPLKTAAYEGGEPAEEPLRKLWSRPPLLWVRLGYLTLLNVVFSRGYRFVRSHHRVWHWSSQHYGSQLDRVAHLHAYLMCAWARKRVPAYQLFTDEQGYVYRLLSLNAFPETTKDAYVKPYGFAERCRNGKIPIAGTLVDESAGSSGTPYNWLRSEQELRDVHLNTANWVRYSFPTDRLFAINAFSMGAWATGTNTAIALSKVCMVKSTGPDLEKIVDTIEQFGPEYDYLVAAYPPFLKHLVDALDANGYDWTRTRVYGVVGGEGMTEAMRDYLERRLVKVRSGYGASDIQIGIAGETDLSVWVRKLLLEREDVREALLGQGEGRVPMAFQYNPLENYIEINGFGEAVITVNNISVLSPKLRYNVGDEGLTIARPELIRRLVEVGVLESPRARVPEGWAAPFFLLYGRRDSTISYMGANIYPIDVEYGLYADERLAAMIESFCLQLQESADLESRPVVNVQLREGALLSPEEKREAAARLRAALVDHLASTSRDFAESLREDPSASDVRLIVHDHGTGPFAGGPRKIKNVYVVDPAGSG